MAQGTKTDKALQQAQATGERTSKQKRDSRKLFKTANRVLGWVIGIVVALVPIIYCWVEMFLHTGNDDIIKKYSEYVTDFVNTGSFLWLSITLLSVSFTDLLLYGFRKSMSTQKKFVCTIFVAISALILFIAVSIYFGNIEAPINSSRMGLISAVSFVLFAIASGFISFKIVQEG